MFQKPRKPSFLITRQYFRISGEIWGCSRVCQIANLSADVRWAYLGEALELGAPQVEEELLVRAELSQRIKTAQKTLSLLLPVVTSATAVEEKDAIAFSPRAFLQAIAYASEDCIQVLRQFISFCAQRAARSALDRHLNCSARGGNPLSRTLRKHPIPQLTHSGLSSNSWRSRQRTQTRCQLERFTCFSIRLITQTRVKRSSSKSKQE